MSGEEVREAQVGPAMVEIKDRLGGRVLYTAERAADVREAVERGARGGVCLSYAVLSDANLSGANLSGGDLWRVDLSDADLSGAVLRCADLRYADLRRADLSDADLSDADLSGANLSGADLWRADLRGANLPYANLPGARWDGLAVYGLPSGPLTLTPTCDGWHLRVGCWSGTVDELEALVAGDDWPDARGEEIAQRRPGLQAVVALCRAHMTANPDVIPELEKRWSAKKKDN